MLILNVLIAEQEYIAYSPMLQTLFQAWVVLYLVTMYIFIYTPKIPKQYI